ncbi:hypothetical protein [Nocardiopsis suaedae]|uniref:Uncharacterized protein n=1 Tax=Nocardiopsis suaedae TaxID=3018444 RepID=A0ABT4TRW2_9ACTN|nr:hypothetical protein [Nocardiopsis suaedae]MDA2807412.1 hypothetical protein [Nocardiopsis suaedae]
MRKAVRAGALVCLAAVAGPVLGAAPAVPAGASARGDGVDAAVEAFASGEVVHIDGGAGDGGAGPTERARAEQVEDYARARLESADVVVRAEVLSKGDAEEAAERTAARVGRPGLYVAAVRNGGAPAEEPDFGWSWVGPAAVTDGELDEHFASSAGRPLERVAGVVDLIDRDLRGAVRRAAESGKRVYVDPSIAEGFPGADAEALARRLGGLEDVRVAVVPALADVADGQGADELAEEMLAPLGGDGSALLAQWRDGAFELTPATGEEGPKPSEITSVLPEGAAGAKGELGAAVASFAGAVYGGVVEDAREGLAEGHLYVHPLAATDLEEGDAEKVDAALAERDGGEEPVRVAVVPQGAFLETGGTGPGDDALAAAVAQGADGPVAVYAVDGAGAITGSPVKGGEDAGGNWGSLEGAVFFGKVEDSVRESLDGMLVELDGKGVLGTGKGGPAAAVEASEGGALGEALASETGRALPWIGGAVAVVLGALFLRRRFGGKRTPPTAAGRQGRTD